MSQFNLSLFDPNTLLPHRAGIAGLALTLSGLDKNNAPVQWEISKDAVSLNWNFSDKEAIEWLMEKAYEIQDGLLITPSLNLSPQGRYTFSQGILSTFLQYSRGGKEFDKTRARERNFEIDDAQITVSASELAWSYYTGGIKKPTKKELKNSPNSVSKKTPPGFLDAFDKKGKFKHKVELCGRHLPGLIEDFTNGYYSQSPELFFALLFLPLACNYYRLPPQKLIGKYRYALVIPEVNNLVAWVERRRLLSSRSYKDFCSPSAGEAGLRLLFEEWLTGDLQQHQVRYCEVYQLGEQPWDGSQSGLKQAVYRVHASDTVLEIYQSAVSIFPAKVLTKEDKSWLSLSKVLPWIADNLISSRAWYSGFYEFTKKRAEHEVIQLDGRKVKPRLYKFEHKGLIKMTEHLQPHEQTLFIAVQGAFRAFRHGQIKQAESQGRKPDWDQITNKVIYRLQRPSTQQEFATALVDFLSQFRSKDSRGVGREIYVWIHGPEWRKARDLTMLAVATYQGKGKDGTPEIVETLPEAEAESEVYAESL